MTTEKIRKDLLDIRYYYARKALFDRAANCIVENTNVERVEKFIYLPWYISTASRKSTTKKKLLRRFVALDCNHGIIKEQPHS